MSITDVCVSILLQSDFWKVYWVQLFFTGSNSVMKTDYCYCNYVHVEIVSTFLENKWPEIPSNKAAQYYWNVS